MCREGPQQAATASVQDSGFPSPAQWLPEVSVPSCHSQPLLLACQGESSGLEDKMGLPAGGTKSVDGFPSYPPPPEPSPFAANRQTEPRVGNVGEIPPLSSYLSQLQEHKDVPIDVHHHLSGFHQPSYRVPLCDTHSQAWAEEPREWTGPCLPPPTPAGPRAGQRGVPRDQERPQEI